VGMKLARRVGQKIVLYEKSSGTVIATVVVCEAGGSWTKIFLEADSEVGIDREEIFVQRHPSNLERFERDMDER
jgi:sRNA-binding carbon storage regulator CsrA